MIRVPEQLGPGIDLRWFTEHVIDNSPLFKTASAIAKASLVLAADLDTVGADVEVNPGGLKLVREALTSEEQPLSLPELVASKTDEEGKPIGEPVKIPPRVYARFIDALCTDVQKETE